MNRKVNAPSREITGTTNEKLFKIMTFHETRLGRIEEYLGTMEKALMGLDEERLSGMEENFNVTFDSIQNLTNKINALGEKSNTTDKQLKKLVGKGSSTTKLAVLGEQLRLLAEKVEKIQETYEENNEDADTSGEEEQEVSVAEN